MTLREMIFEFEGLLETNGPALGIYDRPDTEVIADFLSMAVNQYLFSRYLVGRSSKENVEIVRRNSMDLQRLIVNTDNLPVAKPQHKITYDITAGLPEDLLLYIRSDSEISRRTYKPMQRGWVVNIEADYTDMDRLITNADNRPILLHPVVILRHGNMDIYLDGLTTFYAVKLTYLKRPTRFTLQNEDFICELPEFSHREIVQMAHDMYVREKTLLTTKKNDNTGNAEGVRE